MPLCGTILKNVNFQPFLVSQRGGPTKYEVTQAVNMLTYHMDPLHPPMRKSLWNQDSWRIELENPLAMDPENQPIYMMYNRVALKQHVWRDFECQLHI